MAASDKAQISVLYASAYGNTAALAQGISRGITKAGTSDALLAFDAATISSGAILSQWCHGMLDRL